MRFEDLGVFLSFISYPYHKDGKDLYKKMFDPFFAEHKKQISEYELNVYPDEKPSPCIYQPAGYRMFGSSGLAILSLVDDYSFYNRFFNKNHIQSLLQGGNVGQSNNSKKKNIADLDFKSVVISGVVEREPSERTLLNIAQDTFLQPIDKDRYRYIGIIRLKIDYRLLVGENHGVETVRSIKRRICEIFTVLHDKNPRCDYFAMDCYDNDELTVIAFADQLLTLYNFLGNIRSIKAEDVNLTFSGAVLNNDMEKHVFGLTYLCFGYDLKKGIGEDLKNSDQINCSVETKPGHRDAFYNYICHDPDAKKFGITSKNVNISGGCRIFFTMPLKSITLLEEECKNRNSIFFRDIRDIKVSLIDNIDTQERDLSFVSTIQKNTKNYEKATISRDVFSDVKSLMKRVGVSKMVRERLLALLEFYNLSCQDILQRFYLMELKPALSNFENVIKEMKDDSNENVDAIEQVLNETITNMENACYDRLHIQKSNQAPLEYSGGIQQHLTSFDFVYKQIYRLFSPKDNDAFYITISGAERAASDRTLFKLNIHDIIFPELFVTTTWKEIANFALKSQKKNIVIGDDNPHKELLDTLNTWHDFTKNEDSFRIIRNRIHHSGTLLREDEVTGCIKKSITSDLIEYYIKDYIVYHFAFYRNYKLFWHFYFKILLQTTNCYARLNHMDKGYLISMLLRVFMVAKLATDNQDESNLKDYLDQQVNKPYDYMLSGPWVECYAKTLSATEEIFDVLECFGFREMVDYTIEAYESNLFVLENKRKYFDLEEAEEVFKSRCYTIDKMLDSLQEGALIQDEFNIREKPLTFITCFLGAYLTCVYMLDFSKGVDCPIKSVPRDQNGVILKDALVGENCEIDKTIQILVDTTGGFFIPSSRIRRSYFRLRTTFYRNLWNYRYINSNNTF